ncbi:MAG: hypothetical protein GX142_04975 [Chloroflexi bacterium]|nr:hypothetical protein [Chloroflexota bacterium]
MLVRLSPGLLYALTLLVGLFLLEQRIGVQAIRFARKIIQLFKKLGFINWLLVTILIFLLIYHTLFEGSFLFQNQQMQFFILGHLSLLCALMLIGTGRVKPLSALIGGFSLCGLAIWVLYWIPDIQAYPFSIGWSETTWFYDASLFFSQRIYGFRVPWSSLHPSRYLMQSAAFLIPGLGLWGHRLWQVLLWIGLTLAGGIALSRRIKPANFWIGLGVVAWFSLFTFQGPVYFHLMVVIIIVLLGFNKDKLVWSFFIMVLASLWAGFSRVNWFPVAGMLAATMYILEKPLNEQSFWEYWLWPVLTAFSGLLIAFGSSLAYIFLSGRPAEDFVTSFKSPLLIYRLFPNEAYGMGIINLLLIASVPAFVIILWRVLTAKQAWRPLRLLALLTLHAALLIAGLVVSTKIGGGNNLHNLDAFLVFLAVTAVYVLFNQFSADDPTRLTRMNPPLTLILLAVLLPILFTVNALRPYPTPDLTKAWQVIEQMQVLIEQRTQEAGEVLFIEDRHLLTFGLIEGVKLVPEYEKVFLMEMAMSENEPYIERFQNDIQTQRFDLIVVSPLHLGLKDQTKPFAEENNAWVKYVAKPIDRYYEIVFTADDGQISLLAPKPIDKIK